jgi:hypothetical protein
MRTPPQGEATPPFNIADHLIILTPDAPTRAATAGCLTQRRHGSPLPVPCGIHSRPVLDCVLQRSPSIFFEIVDL